MVKYCCVCREKDDLLVCKACKKCYHEDCAKVRRADITQLSNWLCQDCCDLSEIEIIGKKRAASADVNSNFKTTRKWHTQILQRRVSFLEEKKQLLLPFCSKKKLDILINKASSSSAHLRGVEDLDLSIVDSGTPDYIFAELRPYQLEGVSTLCTWAQRGVGGILSDEMVLHFCCFLIPGDITDFMLFLIIACRDLEKRFRRYHSYQYLNTS